MKDVREGEVAPLGGRSRRWESIFFEEHFGVDQTGGTRTWGWRPALDRCLSECAPPPPPGWEKALGKRPRRLNSGIPTTETSARAPTGRCRECA